MMLTDLPKHWVPEINLLVKELGYTGEVLVSDEGDAVSKIGANVFDVARQLIDSTLVGLKATATIYVAVVADAERSFQACAVELGGDEYCILIWLAAVARTSRALSRLLETPSSVDFFKLNVAAPKIETVPQGQDTFTAYQAISLLPNASLGETGDQFCSHLTSMALEWLVLHELGHIVNGHLAMGGSANDLRYILEENPSASQDENLTGQALEVDADCFANQHCLHRSLNRPNILDDSAAHEADLLAGRLKAYLFSFLSILRSFEHSPFAIETMFHFDHPPGGIRMNYLLAQMLAIENEGKVNFKGVDLAEAAAATTAALERSISQATGINSQGGNFLSVISLSDDAFRKPVLSRWAKIYPELNAVKLTPGKLAPPQYPPA
ncbi:hypothetical protein [Rhizobium leguminosarum]|uniref:hypothetical protein n=1 Tax=Rhizobium leguminosarum TaxID=384 RepID=UPI003F9A23DE